jgi:hypothetical protein
VAGVHMVGPTVTWLPSNGFWRWPAAVSAGTLSGRPKYGPAPPPIAALHVGARDASPPVGWLHVRVAGPTCPLLTVTDPSAPCVNTNGLLGDGEAFELIRPGGYIRRAVRIRGRCSSASGPVFCFAV